MTTLLAAVVLGYLLGAIPSAELAARLRGRHIFDVGSGNMGAMNTARNLGIGLGVAVLVVDIGKGAAATALALALANAGGLDDGMGLATALAAGFAAVTGHAHSVFVGGRGGKALATIFGVSLPLYPVAGLVGLGLILILVAATRSAHRASVATLIAYPWLVALTAWLGGATRGHALALLAGTVPSALVSLARHRRNPPPGGAP